jgi:hypothetical protein
MNTDSVEKLSTPEEERSRAIPDYVRITVINNSQIISSVFRAMSILGMMAFIAVTSSKALSPGNLRDLLRTSGICLLAVGAGFLILGEFLNYAIRRCPICRTRITSATEEKRRCLNCDTELWGYWDE